MNFLKLLVYAGLANAIVHLEVRRNTQDVIPRISKRDTLENDTRGTTEISIDNTISYYKTDLLIGNPPQRVSVQIDTGSSDLWVISSTNPLCESVHAACAWGSIFDSERSETFRSNRSQPFGITYGDSTFASGYFAQDDIGLDSSLLNPSTESRRLLNNLPGEKVEAKNTLKNELLNNNSNRQRSKYEREDSGSSSFLITSANFALADRVNSSEAVWGIGMESTESIARHINSAGVLYPTYPNLPVQMKQQGLIDTVSYSLWLNDLNSSTGSLLFGGVDHAKYHGTLQRVPLVSSYKDIVAPLDFSIIMNGISVYNSEDQSVELVQCSVPVLLDSGTTYCQLPLQLLEPVAKMIGAYHDKKNNAFLVSSNRRKLLKNGGISFNMSGIIIDVAMDELLIPLSPLKRSMPQHESFIKDSTTSGISYEGYDLNKNELFAKPEDIFLLGILPLNSKTQDVYILGDTFLRSAYVVYDLENKEIALANSVQNTSKWLIEKIDTVGIPGAVEASMYSETKIDAEIVTYSANDIFDLGMGTNTAVILETCTQTLTNNPTRTVATSTDVIQTTRKSDKGHQQRNCGSKILRKSLRWVTVGSIFSVLTFL